MTFTPSVPRSDNNDCHELSNALDAYPLEEMRRELKAE